MGFFSDFCEVVVDAIVAIVDFIFDLIDGICSFFNDVVDWFKELNLNRKRHKPFVMNPRFFKEQLKGAPIIKNTGVFNDENSFIQAVYDDDVDDIIDARVVKADGLDDETRAILREPLTVLD